MARSIKKGPFVDGHLEAKVQAATKPTEPTLLYIARVPVGSLQTRAAYEYLAGTPAAPAWTTRPAAPG